MYEEMSIYLEKLRDQKDQAQKMLLEEKEKTLTAEEIAFLHEEMKRLRHEFSGYIGQIGSLLEISQEEYFARVGKTNHVSHDDQIAEISRRNIMHVQEMNEKMGNGGGLGQI